MSFPSASMEHIENIRESNISLYSKNKKSTRVGTCMSGYYHGDGVGSPIAT